MPVASVIIPQHNRTVLTQQAVATLRAYHEQDIEVIVADDGSRPSERQRLLSTVAGVDHLICSPARHGVTVAWNRGARLASAEKFIFLNNDAVTAGEWIPQLLSPLQSPRVLMTGVAVRRESIWPERLLAAHPSRAVLVGWCFALRRSAWSAVGGFDESLRLYFSDTDLQCRLLVRGGESALEVVDGLPVHHQGHASTKLLADRRQQWHDDRARFLEKWK